MSNEKKLINIEERLILGRNFWKQLFPLGMLKDSESSEDLSLHRLNSQTQEETAWAL